MRGTQTLANTLWALLWAVALFVFSTQAGTLILLSVVISVIGIFYGYIQLWMTSFGYVTPEPIAVILALTRWLNNHPLIAHMISTLIFVEMFARFTNRGRRPH